MRMARFTPGPMERHKTSDRLMLGLLIADCRCVGLDEQKKQIKPAAGSVSSRIASRDRITGL